MTSYVTLGRRNSGGSSVFDYLVEGDVFVSPLTGSSLREAAICGLPIVAYEMDWVSGFLNDGETALLAAQGDYNALANNVIRLIEDGELRDKLSFNIRSLASELWTLEAAKRSLQVAFPRIS